MKQQIAERGDREAEPSLVGRQAVVIGAGIAGMTAAGALADYFERVIVLERDNLSSAFGPRPGAPQGWHAHGLLVGGQVAFSALFPGIDEDFARAGAVKLRINQDMREEFPDRDPMPQRDFGLHGYTMTRPLIEATLRWRALQRPNIRFQQNSRVVGIETDPDGRRVTAVRCATADHRFESIQADLVVDASGRGQLTVELLRSIGQELPSESAIGIDLCDTTAIITIPEDAPPDWKVVLTHPDAPRSSRRAVLLPVEGNRWMMTVAGRGADAPPASWDALLDYVRHLSTPTIYNAVRRQTPIGRLPRYVFAESVWRHFEDMQAFPDGLVPIGDAICRFNPIYGQGMTVAAKEAVLLHHVLGARLSQQEPLRGLGQEFLAAVRLLIDTPWTMAAIPDFAYPDTRGDRPADLGNSLQFGAALSRLAAREEAVQKLVIEVWHMLKPRSVYQYPGLLRRVEAEMMVA